MIIRQALNFAKKAIGARYSQDERMKEGVFDCSSLIYRAYRDAGYTFRTENSSSTALVYDEAFDLIWPGHSKDMGKQFTSMAEQRQCGYSPMPGDVIYYCTNSKTTRKNKITHVVMIENENTFIHARGTAYGVRRDPIDLYGKKIVAITRFHSSNLPENSYFARCKGMGVNIRTAPSLESGILSKANRNERLLAIAENEKWALVVCMRGKKIYSGYMHRDYIERIGETA